MTLSIGGMRYLMVIFIGLENKERGQIFSFFFRTELKSKHVCPLSYNYLISVTNCQINTQNQFIMIVQSIEKTIIFEFYKLPIVMLSDRTIWNVKRNKEIKQVLNTRSLGYWIERRFYTLSKLNKLATKTNKSIVIDEVIDCPF
jgi:hypothetical protein